MWIGFEGNYFLYLCTGDAQYLVYHDGINTYSVGRKEVKYLGHITPQQVQKYLLGGSWTEVVPEMWCVNKLKELLGEQT